MKKRMSNPPKRVHVSIRIPEWIVEWLDGVPNSSATRTSLIEYALRKTYKLKEPK
jgi:hypothetical protein